VNPLTEAIFFILLSLVGGKKHGYAIMKDIKYLSNGDVELSTSTLYNALGRMEEQGLINRVDEPDTTSNPGLPRKAYQITWYGRRTLNAEMARLQRLIQAGQRTINGEVST
jgi:DNA-binding PadR family transcriptional regulator